MSEERRRSLRAPRVTHDADRTRLILMLPEHRLRPGATISYTGFDGRGRSITLPDSVRPGEPVRLPTGEVHSSWPRTVELVLLPQF